MNTIVIIDDDEANNRLIKAVLRDYEVVTAKSAETGVQLVRELNPGLVLMDIKMPGMDGVAATQILKHDPETRHIPVIAVTATVMGNDLQRAVQAGCDGYIGKPFSPSELKSLVSQFFSS